MIICSCNVFSDHEVRTAVVVGAPPLTTGQLFRYLGCRARCGCCAGSIKAIMHEHAVAEYEPHITAPKSDAKRLDFHPEKLRPDRNAWDRQCSRAVAKAGPTPGIKAGGIRE
jgi:bacterioferritin-associated ferredoxin